MGNYQVLSKETVFKSQKVQVDRETIRLPDGKTTEWDVMIYPDFYSGVTVRNNEVIMTREWRQGPHDFLTQFTAARAPFETEAENLEELKRELNEELGLIGGKYEKILRFAQGTRLTGYRTVYLVTDFELGKTKRDEDEIQEIISLPIRNLYNELSTKHIVLPETLLIAKILEEKFS